MLTALGDSTWSHSSNPYRVINVTRTNNHFSVGSGYVWTITFATSVGNAPSINVTDSGACTAIQASFTQTGGMLIAKTTVHGYVERTDTLVDNTYNTDTTKWIVGLRDSSMYTFQISAINGVGSGLQSAKSNALSTLVTVDCIMQQWNEWSTCEILDQVSLLSYYHYSHYSHYYHY